jgi:hypothetical protein
LRHHPNLVFLDFSANDGINDATPETLASYEALVRRIIDDGHAAVVEMLFPFGWDAKSADLEKMKRRTAHLAIANAYHAPVGDAISLAVARLKNGETTIDNIWPNDLVHPGNAGYELFADAGWTAYQNAVQNHVTCAAPDKMLYDDTYLHAVRVRISTLGPLPSGWKVTTPNLTSAYFDMLMSRWLDDEVVASNRIATTDTNGKKTLSPQEIAPFTVKFRGAMVLLFGEGTPKSCHYRAFIDEKPAAYSPPGAKEPLREFDAANIAAAAHGNAHHYQVIAEHLDPTVEHTLRIEPLPGPDKEQELRLESICVAGGDPQVFPILVK